MRNLLLLFLLSLTSCVIDGESYLYDINQITKYDVIIISETNEVVNKLNLDKLELIDDKLVYEKINDIKNNKLNKSEWLEKEHNDEYTYYNFFIKNDISDFYNFTIELKFVKYNDNETIYYKQYDAWYMASLYKWDVNGFSLNSNKIQNEYQYEITTYIYFKLMNEDYSIYYIKVPMYIKGTVNIIEETITHNIDI